MKKMFSAIAAVVLSVSLSAGSVMAAPSKTASAPRAVTEGYVVSSVESSESYKTIETNAPAVAKMLDAVIQLIDKVVDNNNIASSDVKTATQSLIDGLKSIADMTASGSLPESAVESAKEVLATIQKENKQVLTNFFDLTPESANVKKTADGKYEVTLKIPAITTSTDGLVALHYDVQNNKFELIPATGVNAANQEATFEFASLSPVMILCNANTGNGIADMTKGTASGSTASKSSAGTTSSTAKSPKTEDTTGNWMGLAAAAVILAGAGVLVIRRKRA